MKSRGTRQTNPLMDTRISWISCRFSGYVRSFFSLRPDLHYIGKCTSIAKKKQKKLLTSLEPEVCGFLPSIGHRPKPTDATNPAGPDVVITFRQPCVEEVVLGIKLRTRGGVPSMMWWICGLRDANPSWKSCHNRNWYDMITFSRQT